jgi:hypothetical protein
MPEAWDEFTRAELAPALGESRYAVDGLLDLAHDLTVKLPGTMALFGVGVISRYKAQVISHATQLWTRRRLAPPRRWCWTGRAG